MGDTFSVLGRKSKKGFQKEKPAPKPKKQTARVTAKRRVTQRDRRAVGEVRPRAKRTLYEDTINIAGAARGAGEATASIEVIRDRKRRRRALWGVLIAAFVTVLVVLIAWVCMVLFFKVERIECEGIELYPADEIISASGITVGQQLYGIDRAGIAHDLCARYPYLKEVKVDFRVPTGVVIRAQEDTAAYLAPIGEHFYVLSPGLRVLETLDDKEEAYAAHAGMVELALPDVSRAIVGEKLVYVRERDEEYITAVLDELLSGDHAAGVRKINLKSKFDLSFSYQSRIDILLGDAQDIPAKIKFAFAIMEQFDENATGTISAEDVESGYALID